jgi:hypothetical protein
MVRALGRFVVLWVVLVAAIASGAPFTSSFDPLRAELVLRRDTAYTGTLDRAQRRELATINSCIARIDGTHASIADDAKSLKFVAKKLIRGFRGEFAGTTPGTLPGLLAGTVTSLLAEAELSYGTLDAAIAAAVSPQYSAQATALANAARAKLDQAALPTTPAATAAALVAGAMKSIVQAIDLANWRPPSGVRCKLGSRSFVAASVVPYLTETGGTVTIGIVARATDPGTGGTETLSLILKAAVGDPIEIGAFQFPFDNYCTYLSGSDPNDTFYSQYSPASYGLITSFDRATGSVSGTFSVDLMRNGRDRLAVRKGTFSFTGLTVMKTAR